MRECTRWAASVSAVWALIAGPALACVVLRRVSMHVALNGRHERGDPSAVNPRHSVPSPTLTNRRFLEACGQGATQALPRRRAGGEGVRSTARRCLTRAWVQDLVGKVRFNLQQGDEMGPLSQCNCEFIKGCWSGGTGQCRERCPVDQCNFETGQCDSTDSRAPPPPPPSAALATRLRI